MDVDKNIEDRVAEEVLNEISENIRDNLKNGSNKVIIFGKEDYYREFIRFFNRKTHYYYSKKVQYSDNRPEIKKEFYFIDINYFYDKRIRELIERRQQQIKRELEKRQQKITTG